MVNARSDLVQVYKWHATKCPFSTSTNGGSSVEHLSWAYGHRVRNLQPDGGVTGLGISPLITSFVLFDSGSGIGTAAMSACVYGWSGRGKKLLDVGDVPDFAKDNIT